MLSDVCAGFGPILSNTEVNTHLCMESETSSALNLALCGPDLVVHLEWVFLPHYECAHFFPSPNFILTPKLDFQPCWLGGILPVSDMWTPEILNSQLHGILFHGHCPTCCRLPYPKIFLKSLSCYCTLVHRWTSGRNHSWDHALQYFKKHSTVVNIISVKHLWMKVQCIMRLAKHVCWKAFVSNHSWSTCLDVVWNKLMLVR